MQLLCGDVFSSMYRSRMFRNNNFGCSAFSDQEVGVELWLLYQGCYFAKFLSGNYDKQAFAMFSIVISAEFHLQASFSSILFLSLTQSISEVEKQHRFKSRQLTKIIGRRDELAAAGGLGRTCRSEVAVSGLKEQLRWPEDQSEVLPRPGRGLCLPAATWHRTRAQGSIVQAWPRNPEQGRDSYILQQAPFSWQTWGKLMLLLCLSF